MSDSDQPQTTANFEIVNGVPVPVSQAETSSSVGRGDAEVSFVEPEVPEEVAHPVDEQKDETPAEPVEEATDVTTPEAVEYRTDEQVAADAETVTEDNNDGQPDPGNSPPEKWTEDASADEQAEVRSLLQVDDTEE